VVDRSFADDSDTELTLAEPRIASMPASGHDCVSILKRTELGGFLVSRNARELSHSRSPSALSSAAPSPRHALPCIHASVAGRALARRSINRPVSGACAK
jgi:hypothetical protein